MKFFEVKNLSVRLGNKFIVKNVSFSVNKGETVALVGPNGAGKTTLLRALLQDIDFTGDILWHEKPCIGYVPQRFDFDKTIPLTVEEFFLIYARKSGSFWLHDDHATGRVYKFLRYVKTEHLIHENVGDISQGELQRVLIALAMFREPNILFMDEPTASVDMEGEKTIYALVKQLMKEHDMTVFFISHDLHVVYDFADKVICLNQKMLCEGAPHAVLNKAQLNNLYGGEVNVYEHHH